MNFKEIEEAYCRTFPVAEVKIQGWLLRTSDSKVRRENSVQVFDAGGVDIESQVSACEKLFDKLGKPAQFRLFSPVDNSKLTSILQARGYFSPDSSYVMLTDLQSFAPDLKPAQEGAQFRLNSLDEWILSYCLVSGKSLKQGEKMKKALKHSEESSCFGTFELQGAPVSAGLSATNGGFCGIFNVWTASEYRGAGFASLLVSSLLSEAKALGAATAYLQVSQDNLAALKVYRKMGFEAAYEYCYWIK